MQQARTIRPWIFSAKNSTRWKPCWRPGWKFRSRMSKYAIISTCFRASARARHRRRRSALKCPLLKENSSRTKVSPFAFVCCFYKVLLLCLLLNSAVVLIYCAIVGFSEIKKYIYLSRLLITFHITLENNVITFIVNY